MLKKYQIVRRYSYGWKDSLGFVGELLIKMIEY